MSINAALEELGGRNTWRLGWYCVVGFIQAFTGVSSLTAFMWAGAIPTSYKCKNLNTVLESNHTSVVNYTSVLHSSRNYAECFYKNDSSHEVCRNGFEYKTYYRKSIVTDWNLVCDRDYLNDLATSAVFFPSIIGAVIAGQLADRLGRRPIFLTFLVLLTITNFAHAFAPNIIVYLILRIITGLIQQGVYATGFCFMVELFPQKYRTQAGILHNIFWTIVNLILVFIVYFVQNWRDYYLTISVPLIVCLPLYYFMPESVAWLVAKGKLGQARQILQRAGRFSYPRPLPSNTFDDLSATVFLSPTEDNKERHIGPLNVSGYSLKTIMSNKNLLRWTWVNIFIWFSTSCAYYALQVQVVRLGNPYLHSFLVTVCEIPAYLIIMPMCQRIGRKYVLSGIQFGIFTSLSFAFLVSLYAEEETNIWIVIVLVGRFFTAASYAIIYLYTSEMFPSTLRVSAIGIASGADRLGVTIAPFLMSAGNIYPYLPYTVLCSMSFCVALMATCLTETSHRKLPSYVEEIDEWTAGKACIQIPCMRSSSHPKENIQADN